MDLPFVGDTVNAFVSAFLSIMATLLVLLLCLAFFALVVVYIVDVTQTRQAIRRNYPVVGHFRYFFEHLGEFFRQYFFPWTAKKCLLIARNAPVTPTPSLRGAGQRHVACARSPASRPVAGRTGLAE